MTKKIMLIALIVCSVFALNVSVNAADTQAYKMRKAGGFDRTRPNQFTASMKRVGLYLLLYVPNRVLDVTDIITFNMSIGGGFQAEMQATRYAQIGGSYGQSYFVSKSYMRKFGSGHKDTSRFGFINMEQDVTYVDDVSGNLKEYVIDFPEFMIADPLLDAFRDDDVDFWKIGGNIGWVAGVGFGIHPVEIADLFLGLFWIDISNDDF